MWVGGRVPSTRGAHQLRGQVGRLAGTGVGLELAAASFGLRVHRKRKRGPKQRPRVRLLSW